MPKNICLFADGTGNEYGRNNTNVVYLYNLAHKGDDQVVCYDPGVGTGDWEYSEATNTLKSLSDKATGYGLQKNVEELYRFLMWVHEPGDRVFLYGFSRGAFTVRSLAGMLRKVGLLYSKFDLNMLEYATKIYNTPDNSDIAIGFKDTFSRPCPVHFIGVWDTIESLALTAGKQFHNYQLDPSIPYAFQAIAIDEARKDYKICLWEEDQKSSDQTIEQVWFAGTHSDIGGFHLDRELADITLKWMARKAVSCGMKINPEKFVMLLNKQDNPNGKIHESYTGLWKIRGFEPRIIPPGSKIHRSVVIRDNYKPDNLPKDFKIVD